MHRKTSQFNAAQANAQAQFNAGQVNTVERFNAEINNQRDQFNAQNQLVISQANAQWRRQIATADTAAVNRANELNANAILDLVKLPIVICGNTMLTLWSGHGNLLKMNWTRYNSLAVAQLDANARKEVADQSAKSAAVQL